MAINAIKWTQTEIGGSIFIKISLIIIESNMNESMHYEEESG